MYRKGTGNVPKVYRICTEKVPELYQKRIKLELKTNNQFLENITKTYRKLTENLTEMYRKPTGNMPEVFHTYICITYLYSKYRDPDLKRICFKQKQHCCFFENFFLLHTVHLHSFSRTKSVKFCDFNLSF